jgi:hypothetical protein
MSQQQVKKAIECKEYAMTFANQPGKLCQIFSFTPAKSRPRTKLNVTSGQLGGECDG